MQKFGLDTIQANRDNPSYFSVLATVPHLQPLFATVLTSHCNEPHVRTLDTE
ncbi:MAG: hypothetical protein ACRC10_04890 [Thermoguttaceae bacterium]